MHIYRNNWNAKMKGSGTSHTKDIKCSVGSEEKER